MKRWLMMWAVSLSCQGQELITEEAPRETIASAVRAVSDLGKEVVLGRYQVAVDRMYPQWKERTAKRMGGMEKLQEQLDGVAREMLRQGISITDFAPKGDPRAYEVFPGKKVQVVDGKEVESLRYTKWLVLVPTVTRFRTHLPGDPIAVIIESTGFQVAIADKGTEDWTFIDGSGVTVNDLRSLFINLPQDLELPPLEKKQIR